MITKQSCATLKYGSVELFPRWATSAGSSSKRGATNSRPRRSTTRRRRSEPRGGGTWRTGWRCSSARDRCPSPTSRGGRWARRRRARPKETSQEPRHHVERGAHADVALVLGEEAAGPGPPEPEQPVERGPLGVHLARRPEPGHRRL